MRGLLMRFRPVTVYFAAFVILLVCPILREHGMRHFASSGCMSAIRNPMQRWKIISDAKPSGAASSSNAGEALGFAATVLRLSVPKAEKNRFCELPWAGGQDGRVITSFN